MKKKYAYLRCVLKIEGINVDWTEDFFNRIKKLNGTVSKEGRLNAEVILEHLDKYYDYVTKFRKEYQFCKIRGSLRVDGGGAAMGTDEQIKVIGALIDFDDTSEPKWKVKIEETYRYPNTAEANYILSLHVEMFRLSKEDSLNWTNLCKRCGQSRSIVVFFNEDLIKREVGTLPTFT